MNSSQEEFEAVKIGELKLANLGIEPWRMNVVVFDDQTLVLFVACGNKIKCLDLTSWGFKANYKKKMELSLLEENDEINQLAIGKNLLISVTMNARVYIYDILRLNLQPVVFNNKYDGIEDCSTWSLDIRNNYLAVGSNSKIISIWNMSKFDVVRINEKEKCQYQLQNFFNGQIRDAASNQYLLEIDTNYELFPTRFSITGNTYNIPCVKFSPCGNYLGSVSIDKAMRVFDVQKGTIILKHLLDDWGWSLEWSTLNNSSIRLIDYQFIVSIAHEVRLLNVVQNDGKYELTEIDKHRDVLNQYTNYARISILKYDEKFELALAVTQHTRTLQFFKMVKENNIRKWNSFELIQISAIDHLIGMSIHHIDSIDPYNEQLFITLVSLEGNFYIYLIQRKKVINSILDLFSSYL